MYLGQEEAAATNHVNILRLKAGEDPLYVAFIMNSIIGRTQTIRYIGGGGQGELYPKDIAKFVVPIVSELEKRRIIIKLNESDTARRSAVKLMDEAHEMVAGLTGSHRRRDMSW